MVVDSGGSGINSGIIIRIDDRTLALMHFDDFFRSHVSTNRDTVGLVHRVRWRDERHDWRWRGKGFITVVDDGFTEVVDATADRGRRFRRRGGFNRGQHLLSGGEVLNSIRLTRASSNFNAPS